MLSIVVIGGGAAGMMAAISAKNYGADVVILERNNRVGKKILATGNGRCNYTNVNLSINNYHGNNNKFPYSCLSQFDVDQTIEFFERLGITPAVEESGKVFPLSFQSSSVLDVLRYELEHLGINVISDAYVDHIRKDSNFVINLKDGRVFNADRVIIATGGKAAPGTGSDGNGYILAEKLGHSIEEVFPGLVQLKLGGDFFKQVNGVKFVSTAGLYYKNKLLKEDRGDILFTNYGVSGPPILQLSRTALELLKEDKNIELKISIINRNQQELYDYLQYRFSFMSHKTIEVSLVGLINKRLIIPVLNTIKIDKNKQVAHLSNDEIRKIATILTDMRFNIIGSKTWQDAQITAGGINTHELDSSTMESKLVEGLYFAGEIVDVDGDCGGFNLQWAWSSGYVSGINSATK